MKFLRYLFVIFIIFSSLFASKTDELIKNKKQALNSNEQLKVQLNKKLSDLANDIVKGENNLKQTNQDIELLGTQIKDLKNGVNEANDDLKKLSSQNSALISNQKKMEDHLIKIISEKFSYDLIISNEVEPNEESIISKEVLQKLSLAIKNEISQITSNYSKTLDLIKDKSIKIKVIKSDLKEFENKKSKLKSLQNSQKNTLANLKRDKNIYLNKIRNLEKMQKDLRNTLEKLAIVSKNEKTEPKISANDANIGSVKRFGTSYQASKVKKYRGKKTIAPLEHFTIKQKFGNYTDPIYKIKIFNESVILRSNNTNARVKSVLSGKVVYANETAILEKVIIVENSNGIHTIYANLDKIAPTIKVGKYVKKGYIIGRVKQDLTFEVTQKKYHINPLELITLS